MQTQVTQTNTTAAVSVFSHADIVRVLGLAAMMDAGLPRDVPGTTMTVQLGPAEADGEFTATVYGLIDHNYVAPQPDMADGAGTGDPSLNSAASDQPATPAVPATPPTPGAPSPAIGGLQIPVTPTA